MFQCQGNLNLVQNLESLIKKRRQLVLKEMNEPFKRENKMTRCWSSRSWRWRWGTRPVWPIPIPPWNPLWSSLCAPPPPASPWCQCTAARSWTCPARCCSRTSKWCVVAVAVARLGSLWPRITPPFFLTCIIEALIMFAPSEVTFGCHIRCCFLHEFVLKVAWKLPFIPEKQEYIFPNALTARCWSSRWFSFFSPFVK